MAGGQGGHIAIRRHELDCLHVQGIRGYGYTGLLPAEQSLGQWFEVNLHLYLDVQAAGQSDRLEETLDYHALIVEVQALLRRSRFALIERLATVIAEAVLAHPPIQQVKVTLIKRPAIPDFDGHVQVELVRARNHDA